MKLRVEEMLFPMIWKIGFSISQCLRRQFPFDDVLIFRYIEIWACLSGFFITS